jgi:hypothetical protein
MVLQHRILRYVNWKGGDENGRNSAPEVVSLPDSLE